MSPINRRELLELGIACGMGAIVGPGCSRMLAGTNPTPTSLEEGYSPIKTRMLWTWDHSTEWALNLPGAHTIGSCNDYGRTKTAFLADYSALLRWCGRNNIDALVVWGLLRDCHGGLETAKQLCDIAMQEGVRLIPGVGLNAYGGVYYEGESTYNLEKHLQLHPELYAVDAEGNSINFSLDANGNRHSLGKVEMPGPRGFYHACPSRPENQDFIAESLNWLFNNLKVGGVQIETGDTGVCQCKICRERRVHPVSNFSWEDMALMYPLATNVVRSVSSDAWIVCETYSHPQPYTGPKVAPGFGEGKAAWANDALSKFPQGVFVQWVGDRYLREKNPALVWNAEGRVSNANHRHVMRTHFGTNWGWRGFRGESAVALISQLAQQSIAAGIDTLSLFGEVSPFLTGAEFNYLALADFGGIGNPSASLSDFEQRIASPLLGGDGHAKDFFQFATLLGARYPEEQKLIPEALASIYGRIGSLPMGAAKRWCWLANTLASYLPQ